MRQWLVGVLACGCLGLAVNASLAQTTGDKEKKPSGGGFFPKIFGGSGGDKKPVTEPENVSDQTRADEVKASYEAWQVARDRELDEFMRREAICDKLRWIAGQTNDEALVRQAEILYKRACDIRDRNLGQPPSSEGFAPGSTSAGSMTLSPGQRTAPELSLSSTPVRK